ncbi:ArdC-like ssDNA-binding domain-containing protein [Sinomonas sp. G460-2]|uniref:ArdC-like ssDNA-binding domain-containing protein n=1 Tax=Sinomonas sp. G460-2 TaxID=3393464 RepID=UPI0039EDF2B3
MSSNTAFGEKAAERKTKIDALHEKLTSTVESLITGEDWRRAMEFAARFRSRSFNNTLLIYIQHYAAYEAGLAPEPMPTHVAGYQQWRDLGRNVSKGQPGYQIFAPVTARMASREPANAESWRRLARGEKPEPGEVVRTRMVGAKPAYVWDISQTQGPPIPDVPAPKLLTGEAPAGLWDGLADIVSERGLTLHDAPDAEYLDGANGMTHWLKRTVHVRADMDAAARVRTLSHEVGHIVLHDRDNVDAVLHRGIAEVEAESVALMITAAHGMDSSQYTIPYVATWASQVPNQDPVQAVQSTAARVRTAALGVLERLDTTKIPDGTPPALDRPPTRAPAINAARSPSAARAEGVSR